MEAVAAVGEWAEEVEAEAEAVAVVVVAVVAEVNGGEGSCQGCADQAVVHGGHRR